VPRTARVHFWPQGRPRCTFRYPWAGCLLVSRTRAPVPRSGIAAHKAGTAHEFTSDAAEREASEAKVAPTASPARPNRGQARRRTHTGRRRHRRSGRVESRALHGQVGMEVLRTESTLWKSAPARAEFGRPSLGLGASASRRVCGLVLGPYAGARSRRMRDASSSSTPIDTSRVTRSWKSASNLFDSVTS
jgi:hypothetical protein